MHMSPNQRIGQLGFEMAVNDVARADFKMVVQLDCAELLMWLLGLRLSFTVTYLAGKMQISGMRLSVLN